MSERILVTGIGGFIGSHFLEHVLLNTDWEILGVDSFRHRGVFERITDSDAYRRSTERVQIFAHDLVAPISRVLAQRLGQIDIVVNFASESHVDRSIADPVPFVLNNVGLALNMLEYARAAQPRIFIQVSTDEVYGPARSGETHPEWSPILPSNPYAASKAAQEAIATSYWRTYDVPVVITNTMNNFGERQDPEKFIPMVIKRVLEGGTVTIHGSPDQIGSRFYIHCRNHADGLLFIIHRLSPTRYSQARRPGQIARPDRYNIVGEKEVNNLELAQLVARAVGRPLKHEFLDFHATRPGHDLRYGLDGSKLAALGWTPPVTFEESLDRTVKWTLQHREWLL